MAESAEDSPERSGCYSDKCDSGASTFLLRPLGESSRCVISPQTNVYLRLERAMNRAFASDFDQLRVLFLGQRTGQLHLHVDPIEQALLGFAFFTIFRVNARVRERDNNVFQWNLFPARVKPDRHRCTHAQGDQQIIVGTGRSIVAARRSGFISLQMMPAAHNFLEESIRVTAHNNMRRFLLAVVAWSVHRNFTSTSHCFFPAFFRQAMAGILQNEEGWAMGESISFVARVACPSIWHHQSTTLESLVPIPVITLNLS